MASLPPPALRFLDGHRVGHLATAGPDGMPHVIPVCYAVTRAALYFVADEKPKRRPARELLRLRNLRHNPQAALVVDDYDDDWERLAFVLVRGPARFLAPGSEHSRALALLRARYPQYQRMALEDPERNPLVAIRPRHVVMWRARR